MTDLPPAERDVGRSRSTLRRWASATCGRPSGRRCSSGPSRSIRSARRLRGAVNVDDLRRIAKRRLPRGVFDYIDGAAEDERSLRNNSRRRSPLGVPPERAARRQRDRHVARRCSAATVSMPLVLAPTGYTRLTHSEGELSVARAAAACRRAVLAVDDEHPLDRGGRCGQRRPEVVPGLHLEGPGARARAGRAIGRRRLRGAVAHRRHGGARQPRARRSTGVHRATRRSARERCSTVSCTRRGRTTSSPTTRSSSPNVAHVPERAARQNANMGRGAYVMANFDQKLSWSDVEWLQSVWDGPILLKGIQSVGDAERGRRARCTGHRRCPITAVGSSTTRRRRSTSSTRSVRRSRTRRRSSATEVSDAGATW